MNKEAPETPYDGPSAAMICRLLSTPERLRAVAALALGSSSISEVAGITGLMSRDAGQALTRLVGAGLVEVDGIGRYRLREDAFAGAAGAAGDDEAPAEDYGTEDPEVAN